MQMVSAVVAGKQLRGVTRIAHSLVEINHSIEFTAAANPGVDLLTNRFLLGKVEAIKERATLPLAEIPGSCNLDAQMIPLPPQAKQAQARRPRMSSPLRPRQEDLSATVTNLPF